jgi:16S rRNA U1498 N3-methylase RsmE
LEEAAEQGEIEALCKVKEEKKFEARLKELEKILNYDAKA